MVLPIVAARSGGDGVGQVGYRGPLAPSGLPPVLAMAFEIRTAGCGSRDSRSDSGDEQRQPALGCTPDPRELLKLGIEISQATVAKYMVLRRATPPQIWRSFLRNQIDGIAAIDTFVVVTAAFRLLYVSVILSRARRNIVHLNVTQHPTACWLSSQVTEAFPWGHCSALSAARSRCVIWLVLLQKRSPRWASRK
jgi:hypothetical protein